MRTYAWMLDLRQDVHSLMDYVLMLESKFGPEGPMTSESDLLEDMEMQDFCKLGKDIALVYDEYLQFDDEDKLDATLVSDNNLDWRHGTWIRAFVALVFGFRLCLLEDPRFVDHTVNGEAFNFNGHDVLRNAFFCHVPPRGVLRTMLLASVSYPLIMEDVWKRGCDAVMASAGGALLATPSFDLETFISTMIGRTCSSRLFVASISPGACGSRMSSGLNSVRILVAQRGIAVLGCPRTISMGRI